MAGISTATSEVLANLTSLYADSSKWSSSTWSAFGATSKLRTPLKSYDSIVDLKSLTVGEIVTHVGFSFREKYDALSDRCELGSIYPVGIAVYQKFRAPGTTDLLGTPAKIDDATFSNYMAFVEELETNLYGSAGSLPSFKYKDHEAEFDHETVGQRYLKTVLVYRYLPC